MSVRHVLALLVVALVVGTLILGACAQGSPTPAASSPTQQPAGPTAAADSAELLLQQRCVDCHSLDRITSASKTAAEWERAVQRMMAKGARLSAAESAALVEYLAANYK